MNIITVTLLLLFSIPMSGQRVCLDTIQSVKGKPVFHIIVTKTANDTNQYALQFLNCSHKNMYLNEAELDYSYVQEDGEVEFGLNYYALGDMTNYKVLKIKPNETLFITFRTIAKKINLMTSLILKERFITPKNGAYFIEKGKYHDVKKAFTYSFE